MAEDKITIGIDFGTTFSGIGWIYPKAREGVGKVVEFPLNGVSQEKIPTEILYGTSSADFKWGWEAQGNPRSRKFFKLKLDPHQHEKVRQLQELELSAAAQTQPSPRRIFPLRPITAVQEDVSGLKTVKDVCTDYLKAIREEAIRDMEDELGTGESSANTHPEVVEITPKRYVLTVPAMWSEQAKDATEQCAKNAFGRKSDIEIIAEPQAAAIFTLQKKRDTKSLAKGGHYVVCDAGGGTVDLVTYQVLSTEPLELGVSVQPRGDVCGALLLNRGFEEYLTKKVEDYLQNPDVKSWLGRMRVRFEEQIKRTFASEAETITLALPRVLRREPIEGSEDGDLIIEGKDLAKIFEPVITRILELIRYQIRMVRRADANATIAGIILVGGLGRSPYLMNKVKEEFPSLKRQILRDPLAWSAVTRGALLWGVDRSTVTKYRSNRAYGTEVTADWKREWDNDPKRKKVPHQITKAPSCLEMKWHIEEGEEFSRELPATSQLSMQCPSGKTYPIPEFAEISLWAWDRRSEFDERPEIRDNSMSLTSCYRVGTLQVPLDWLKKKAENNPSELLQFLERDLYFVHFKIELLFSTVISFGANFEGMGGPKVAIRIQYPD